MPILFIIAVTGIMLIAPDASAIEFLTESKPTDMILDIVKEVLKVIVEFIGDILDEFVRAIKDLMGGSTPSKK